jgi:glycosyltransferase involved in cell wall biosynthesis
MRVLILNWRCPKNPRAGGAEFLTQEIAKRLVAAGDQVEWFSASYPGAAAEEDLDGVHVVRAGRQWTVHLRAFLHYFRKLRSRFDVVVDEVNTMPFFTPLWADVPVFMLIYQLAREVWWYESPFPINVLGYLLEPAYLRIYRRIPAMTISASTESDLRRLGFSSHITVVPIGISAGVGRSTPKRTIPTFLYVGRLARSKRVGDVINAFGEFRAATRTGELWLVGEGPIDYVSELRELSNRLGVARFVHFLGKVGTAERNERMAESYALLMASVREGFGLVVAEAGACGTPAVVYNVPGLRDAVRHEQSGLIVEQSPASMARGMIRLWDDRTLYSQLCEGTALLSQSFSLDASAQVFRRNVSSGLGDREVLKAVPRQ